MFKKVLMIVMSVVVLSSALYTPESEAAIGLIAKSKVVKTVGGVAAATGGVIGGVGLISLATTADLGVAILGAVGVYIGVITVGIGLIILDDKTVAELSFDKVYPGEFQNISADEVMIYNRELQMLNSIKETIAQELPDDTTVEEAGDVWSAYSGMLSPATMKVAGLVSERFIAQ
jgi:hypothetical protein